MPKRHKYALDVQTKIAFAILLALPQQKTLRNGDYYEISETAEKIYIGKDFPDEFAHGKDKTVLKGPNLKAKANAAQAVEELIQIAENKSASEDFKEKHGEKAKYGWYRYDTRLALPVYNDEGVENFEGVPEFWEVKKLNLYKYELHVHTSECDPYARLSARELVHLYKNVGYDGMVITDHYMELFYTQWFSDELEGLTHEQQVARWLKGFRTAKEEGDKIGFTVLAGAEVRFNGYPNDYLIYGLQEDFFYTAPRLNELKNIQELLAVLPPDVCVVQAHPFRDEMVVANPKGLFGLEVYNGGTEKFRNDIARQFACHYNLAMTSGSDIHGMERLAKGGIMTPMKIETPKDLITVLRNGEYSLIEND